VLLRTWAAAAASSDSCFVPALPHREGDSPREQLAARLAAATHLQFGAEAYLLQQQAEEAAAEDDGGGGAQEALVMLRAAFMHQLDSKARVCFDHVFESEMGEASTLPLKLEIGCGAGEWVAAQAAAERGVANWGALELRQDRAFATWCRAALATPTELSNLAVLRGDAHRIVESHLQPRSVNSVFINHPEPPERTGGESESQGSHLLTSAFFMCLHRVLKVQPKTSVEPSLVIATDNLKYGRTLLQSLAKLSGPRGALFAPLEVDYDVQEQCGKFCLFRGTPGDDCGWVVEASSYFDRFWNNAQLTKRFFICLQKVKK
jgi:tRNA G46 methylase TrmB